MEVSSHYYALFSLCRTCGIKKDIAYKIAYASQFVDDAQINYLFVNNPIQNDPLFIENEDGSTCIQNIATCHSYFKIKTYNFDAMIFNTCAFHFIPGCEGETFTEKLVCKEDSKVLNTIMNNNLNSTPEKFGILLHIYADSFSHQGFSGLLSKKNNIENLKPLNATALISLKYYLNSSIIFIKKLFRKEKTLTFKDFIPAYGHGQAEHYPDIPYLKWSYNYNNESHKDAKTITLNINNQERFKRAFENIKKYLNKYIEENSLNIEQVNENNFEELFQILISKASKTKKIALWKEYLIKNNYCNEDSQELEYDGHYWIKDTFRDFNKKKYQSRIVNDAKLTDNYKEKSWYKFVEGVKSYKIELVEVLKDNGLELPR